MAGPQSPRGSTSSPLADAAEDRGGAAGGARARGGARYLLVGAGALVLGLLLLPALPPGIWHDDGVYLLLGRALASGDGLHYVGVPGDPPAPKFPPVYPAVLAVLWWLSDNPYGVAQVAGVLNVAFLAAAVALTARWAVGLGLSAALALGASVLVLFSVELWQTAMVALSEPLFVLATVAVLIAAAGAEREGGRSRALVLSALLLLAVHVRTAGVALAVGAVAGLALRRRWRESAWVAGVCTAGMLPWLIWSSRATERLPGPLRDILGSYGGWLGERVLADPGTYLASLWANLVQNGVRFAGLLLPGAGPGVLWVLGPPAAFLVAGGAIALGRRSPTAALALCLLLVEVWLWPFDATRLLVPVFPLAAVAVACAVQALSERRAAFSAHRRRVLGAFAVGVVAFALASVLRMAGGEVAGRYYARGLLLQRAAQLIERSTPPDAVVGAPELWAAIPLVTGRRSAPSAPFRPDPTGRTPTGGTPGEQLAVWKAGQLEYLFLEHEGRVNGPALDLLGRTCPGSMTVLGAADAGDPGGGRRFLVRLGSESECRDALASGPPQP